MTAHPSPSPLADHGGATPARGRGFPRRRDGRGRSLRPVAVLAAGLLAAAAALPLGAAGPGPQAQAGVGAGEPGPSPPAPAPAAGGQTFGPKPAATDTAGMQTTGIQTTGMQTTGTGAADKETLGTETAGAGATGTDYAGTPTGTETAGTNTTGTETTGMQAAGMQTDGTPTTDVQTAGTKSGPGADGPASGPAGSPAGTAPDPQVEGGPTAPAAGGAVAPDPATAALTLPEAVAAALAHNPAVAEARHRETAAVAAVAEARADRRPQAGLRASAYRYEEPIPVTPIHGFGPGLFPEFDRTVGQGELSVRWDLYDGGADRARLDRARAEAAAAGRASAASRDGLVAATVAAYVRVLSLEAVLDAHRRRIEALEAERGRVELLFRAGRAADVDRMRIGAALAGAGAERVRLESTVELAERDLARLTGLPGSRTRGAALRPVVLAGEEAAAPPGPSQPAASLPGLPSRDALARRALDANPRVGRARAEVAAAETAVELARSQRRPTVGVRGAWQEFASGDGRETGEWLAGVEVTVPLFDGGRVAARVRSAEARAQAAAARLEDLRLEVLGELDSALADLRQAVARAAALEEAVEQYVEVARVEALRLEHGSGTQTGFLDAQADLLETRADLAQARFAGVTACTRVARIAGSLDPGWVETRLVPPDPPPARDAAHRDAAPPTEEP